MRLLTTLQRLLLCFAFLISLVASKGCVVGTDIEPDDDDEIGELSAAVATMPLRSPMAGATVSGTITIDAAAPSGTAKVAFFVDGVRVGVDTSGPSWTFPLDTTKYLDGKRTLTAVARKADSTRLAAATVTVTVANAGGKPHVAIRVFPHYSGSTYGNHESVLQQLGRLGVSRISALLYPTMSGEEIKFYQNAYSRYGIRVWFAVGSPGATLSDADWTKVRNLLTGPLAGITEVASGWNEPNHRLSGDWATPTANHQKKLWANIQQVNAAAGQTIRVGTPPLWSGSISTQFSDLAILSPKIKGAYDTINWHMYPHGNTGSALASMVDAQVTQFRAAYGSFPMLNSESGYFTAENYTGGSNPSTEAEQAAQLPDLVNFHLSRGISISYFELLDDVDPSGANREAHFGLVRTPSLSPSTWTDKPAFAVFKNLVTR
ncbi:MAG: Ig-like domain-containing protein [Deltaproteobacteria bacterium]|nr:Ig-like domain-containing protein [Deltaproteobacteria bacterium]MDQ3296930.1 Ig-like domain-containing protein [Myxococcota bacterium]